MGNETTNLILAIANSIVAFGAILALFVGVRQIRSSREISAIEAYEEYHKFSLQYPQFSNGAKLEMLSERELEQYLSFVLYVLMIGERIHILFPKSKVWNTAIEDDVRIHRELITSEKFAPFLAQEWVIDPILRRVVEETNHDRTDVSDTRLED